MRLEMKRSGGFTGTTHRWRLETADEGEWRSLIDRAGLRFRGPLYRVGRLLVANPFSGGHHDYQYTIWVDGRPAYFRGIDVSGPVAELVDRVTREGDEIHSP
jgi:hypothetical protein